MSDAYGPQGGGGGGASDVEGANVGELVTKVEKMEGELSDLAQSVESATRAMHSGGGVSEDTLSAVWEALPKGPDRATTAEGVAEGLDVDVSTVRLALEQLHETTSTVRKREAQEVEGEVTITDERGRELGHGGSEGVVRRNPLWYKVEK
ncbi:hypothetical protein [Halospeciosus flavus]|uniref:MarR family transcriptional regulator n=1 Tax=Halospeciosus flavus TaxID=3032283 RepID=A0ABD5Z291_9EURY|nr:hypothetical protein [Halospeciosus flavus]